MVIDICTVTKDMEILQKMRETGLPVVIWGNGEVATKVHEKLTANHVKNIFHATSQKTKNCLLDSKVDAQIDKYYLVAGFLGAYSMEAGDLLRFKNRVAFYKFAEIYGLDKLDKGFYHEHEADFNRVYDHLADEKSRKTFEKYLTARINEDASALKGYVEVPQYFSGDFLTLSDHEFLVDCGAYIGDSIMDFNKATKGKYLGIVAFEPDEENAAQLKVTLERENLQNVTICKMAAYAQRTQLHFMMDQGMMASITDSGKLIVDADSIDHVVGDEKVTFIKMDVEGSEMEALRGARYVIQRDHPVLAISAYHKPDDLYTIFDFISGLWDGYKFYFRAHKMLPIDSVLYAVPC